MGNYSAEAEFTLSTRNDAYLGVGKGYAIETPPKAFLKRIDSVDLSILTGFAATGRFIPVASPISAHSTATRDLSSYNYSFNAADKEVYTFGITLIPKNAGTHNSVRIAVVFIVSPMTSTLTKVKPSTGRVGLAQKISDDIELTVTLKGVWAEELLMFVETNKTHVTLPNNTSNPTISDLIHYAKQDGFDTQLALNNTINNPFYMAAVYARDAMAKKNALVKVIKQVSASTSPSASVSTATEVYEPPDVETKPEHKSKNPDVILHTLRRITKKIGISKLDKDGNETTVKHSVGSLPNGWEWVDMDADEIQLIARNGNIAFLHHLADEGRLSEEVVEFMLEQADKLQAIANAYKIVAHSKLPEARYNSAVKSLGKNKDEKDEQKGEPDVNPPF